MPDLSPFERDILEQPAALLRQADYTLPEDFAELAGRDWDRIILTGMGSSHFAGIPTWRALTRLGRAAWSIDTGRLLDSPDLLTPRSLVIATSQSGESAEIVELLHRVEAGRLTLGKLVGVTDSPTSTLAQGSSIAVDLNSGPEATVSTKSYLNSLAVHARIAAAFAGKDDSTIVKEIVDAAKTVEVAISQLDLQSRAQAIVDEADRRIVTIGQADDAATSLYAALIAKEASKVAVEGFVGGQFRHGPFELAGRGLTAILYGVRSSGGPSTLQRLARDLVETGSEVVVVGDVRIEGAETLWSPPSSPLGELANDAVVAELFAVALAKANGVRPGSFAYGSKITTAL